MIVRLSFAGALVALTINLAVVVVEPVPAR